MARPVMRLDQGSQKVCRAPFAFVTESPAIELCDGGRNRYLQSAGMVETVVEQPLRCG